MPRPPNYYVVWTDDRRVLVVKGRAAAAALSPSFKSFRRELDAEEFAAWWQYRHQPVALGIRITRTTGRSV